MKMGMKPGEIAEGVNDPDHSQYTSIDAHHRAKGDPQALTGTEAKLCQEFSVAPELDAQHSGDSEDELLIGDGVWDVMGGVIPELNGSYGLAIWAEPPAQDRNVPRLEPTVQMILRSGIFRSDYRRCPEKAKKARRGFHLYLARL